MLGAYRAATLLLTPTAPWLLARRLRRGKEDAARLGERLGRSRGVRPAGQLVWLHGASVGEALAVLPLVERLAARGVTVLVTTGTVTSARLLATRLPDGALHQFVPLDVPGAVRRFLDHWRPGLVLLAESELWPNLIAEAAGRHLPVLMVNARMSPRSFGRWRRLPRFIQPLLSAVTLALAQSEGDAERLTALGAPAVTVAGNLKFDTPPPPFDAEVLAGLAEACDTRPCWLAASTHPDEHAAVLDAHQALTGRHPAILTVVAPRHPDQGAVILAEAERRGLPARLRSRGEMPDETTALYIADTIGELGLLFRLCPVAFVGKSLGSGGGQNPLEPAKLGCAVVHGPAVVNFADIYRSLDEAGGARLVRDAAELAAAIGSLLDASPARIAQATKAAAVVKAGAGATIRTLAALEPFLARLTHDQPA